MSFLSARGQGAEGLDAQWVADADILLNPATSLRALRQAISGRYGLAFPKKKCLALGSLGVWMTALLPSASAQDYEKNNRVSKTYNRKKEEKKKAWSKN